MNDAILITELNDFIFCPVSIYFHHLYGGMDTLTYQSTDQVEGTAAHKTVDSGKYSTRKDILQGMDVYCDEFRLIGKIDTYDVSKSLLRERKKKIVRIYDGYVFQLYAQCLALREMGYAVNRIELYSIDDNKTYPIDLPENDLMMFDKFKTTIHEIREFQIKDYYQTNPEKCKRCIYEPSCDRSI